jgi:osmotically-inducible protein OsmY
VVAAAHRALQNSPHLAVRRIWCGFHEGQLTLHGQVPTFYLLQIAQELVCRLPGVEEVENRIVVASAEGVAGNSSTSEAASHLESVRTEHKLPRRTRIHVPELAAAVTPMA